MCRLSVPLGNFSHTGGTISDVTGHHSELPRVKVPLTSPPGSRRGSTIFWIKSAELRGEFHPEEVDGSY